MSRTLLLTLGLLVCLPGCPTDSDDDDTAPGDDDDTAPGDDDDTGRWCMARRLDLMGLLGPRCSLRINLRRRPRWPRVRRAR